MAQTFGDKACPGLPVKLIDQKRPAIVQQDRASMRAYRRCRHGGQSCYQCPLFVCAQVASTAQGRTAGEANEQVIFPISAILGCKLRQLMDVSRQLLLPGTAGHRTYQETAATKTFAL